MSKDYWNNIFRWTITTLIFGIYIALVFFTLRGDWSFLVEIEYYFTTITSTSFAFFLRYLWAFKGLELTLLNNKEISEKEIAKGLLLGVVNSNNLTDDLEKEIQEENNKNKLKSYKNKCDYKINRLSNKKYKWLWKGELSYWKDQRIFCDKPSFNVDIVKVKFYKYDIDSMLSTYYKPQNEIETRGSLNKEIFGSYRTNLITFVSFAVLKGLDVFVTSFTTEDLFVLLGQITVFTMNIYSGMKLGTNFIDVRYSNDLTKDYVFLKTFLKKYKEVVA